MKLLLKTAAKLLSGQFLMVLIVLLQGIVLVKSLGADNYGCWVLIQGFYLALMAFVGFRVTESLIKSLVHCDNYQLSGQLKARLVGISVTIDIGTRLIVLLIILTMGDKIFTTFFTKNSDTNVLLLLYGLENFFQSLNNSWLAIQRIANKIWQLSIIPACFSFARLALSLYFVIFTTNFSLIVFAVLSLCVAALFCLLQFYHIYRWLRLKNNTSIYLAFFSSINKADFYDYFEFLKKGWFASTFSAIVKQADIIVLGAVSTTNNVAYYKVAKSIFSFYQTASTILAQVVFLDINKEMYKKNIQLVFAEFTQMSKIMALPMSVIAIVAWMVANYFIPIVYGNDFAEASVLLAILLVGGVLNSIFFWAQGMVLSANMYLQNLYFLYSSGIVGLIGYALLAKSMESYGIAISFSISWMLVQILPWIYLYKTTTKNRSKI